MIDGLSYGGDSLYTRRTWSALEIREREREHLRAEKARKARGGEVSVPARRAGGRCWGRESL